jgi:hypothetical protein
MINMFCNYNMKFRLYLVAMHERALFIDGIAQESHESHDWGLWLFVHSSFQRTWTKSVYCILHKHLFAECRIMTSPITRCAKPCQEKIDFSDQESSLWIF